MTGIQSCQVSYEIFTRETSKGKAEGSCLLLIIESCNVFSKAKTDRTYPVHQTSVLEEDCAKSALSFHENASLW